MKKNGKEQNMIPIGNIYLDIETPIRWIIGIARIGFCLTAWYMIYDLWRKYKDK